MSFILWWSENDSINVFCFFSILHKKFYNITRKLGMSFFQSHGSTCNYLVQMTIIYSPAISEQGAVLNSWFKQTLDTHQLVQVEAVYSPPGFDEDQSPRRRRSAAGGMGCTGRTVSCPCTTWGSRVWRAGAPGSHIPDSRWRPGPHSEALQTSVQPPRGPLSPSWRWRVRQRDAPGLPSNLSKECRYFYPLCESNQQS